MGNIWPNLVTHILKIIWPLPFGMLFKSNFALWCDQIRPNNTHLLFSYTKYITGKKVLGTLSPKFAQVAVKKYDTKITKYFLFNLKFYLMKQDVKS